jgi:hypothetical protein
MGTLRPTPRWDGSNSLASAAVIRGLRWPQTSLDKATRLATEAGLSTSTRDRNRRQLISIGRSVMRRPATSALALVLTSAAAFADDIVLRGMGSLHVGGRIVELHGRPVREIVRVPGGPSSKLDPNGQYQVEQMYAQYFLPKNLKGKVPLLMWHGGGLTGVTYETTPDGREGWLNMFVRGAGTFTSRTPSSAGARVLRALKCGRESRSSCPTRIRSSVFASEKGTGLGMRTPPSRNSCRACNFRSTPMQIT